MKEGTYFDEKKSMIVDYRYGKKTVIKDKLFSKIMKIVNKEKYLSIVRLKKLLKIKKPILPHLLWLEEAKEIKIIEERLNIFGGHSFGVVLYKLYLKHHYDDYYFVKLIKEKEGRL